MHRFISRKTIALSALLAFVAAAPALAVGAIQQVALGEAPGWAAPYVEMFQHRPEAPAADPLRIVGWEGKDIDGDGAADILNPTGHAPRDHDAYGSGAFGASRDGGAREHAGVDYVANVGQAVLAPISGFVSKVGFPYGDDAQLRYVQIDNPALKISARVFYVDPQVQPGQAVRMGSPIGSAQTLQGRYPGGITDHVHLEVADQAGRKLDAARLITARLARVAPPAAAIHAAAGD